MDDFCTAHVHPSRGFLVSLQYTDPYWKELGWVQKVTAAETSRTFFLLQPKLIWKFHARYRGQQTPKTQGNCSKLVWVWGTSAKARSRDKPHTFISCEANISMYSSLRLRASQKSQHSRAPFGDTWTNTSRDAPSESSVTLHGPTNTVNHTHHPTYRPTIHAAPLLYHPAFAHKYHNKQPCDAICVSFFLTLPMVNILCVVHFCMHGLDPLRNNPTEG